MFSSFFWENAHFSINLFTFLAFLAAFWLHFDAWLAKKHIRSFLGLIGWLMLGAAFIINSTKVESTFISDQIFPEIVYTHVLLLTKLIGYLIVSLSMWLEPIQPHPLLHTKKKKVTSTSDNVAGNTTQPSVATIPRTPAGPSPTGDGRDEGSSPQANEANAAKEAKEANKDDEPVVATFALLTNPLSYTFITPLATFSIAVAYWRRATTGIERHVKPMAYVFLAFTGYEVLSIFSRLRDTANPTLFNLVTPFGPIWIAEQASLLIAASLLIRWVGQYLLRRLQTQLFMIFISMALGAFLLTSTTFSILLLQNMQAATLDRLHADVKALGLMLEQKQQEVTSTAELIAADRRLPELLKGARGEPRAASSDDATDPSSLVARDSSPTESGLAGFARDFILAKQVDTLIIMNADGQVIARGENPDSVGDSLSEDPLFKAVKEQGKSAPGLTRQEGAVAPLISVRAAAPIKQGEAVIGVVITGAVLDNAFVDGIKRTTGLDAAVYADNTLSASTIVLNGDSSRWIGTQETNEQVTEAVLTRKEELQTQINLLNQPYLASYLPLVNREHQPIGMLFVGTPHLTVLRTAATSLQLTFIITAVLMIISIFPSLYFARLISGQVR